MASRSSRVRRTDSPIPARCYAARAVNFEEHRSHLRLVAYRILGSPAEADDAVQEAWLKSTRTDPDTIDNPRGWLTTVVARVCLDMLRTRTSRREEPLAAAPEPSMIPADDRELLESVGAALHVVLDKLDPAERIAFVLHDQLAMTFDAIAPIVGRSTIATRQLASRARRRVQRSDAPPVELAVQRHVVEAFIAAMRAGDVEGLVALLDPAANVRMDGGDQNTVQDARAWAKSAVAYKGAAQHMRPLLVDGRVALALAPHGKVARVLVMSFVAGKIREVEIITEPEALAVLEIAELP